VVKILQGSVVTKTTLGGLTIHPRVANFLQCVHAKNYENWLAVDKVTAKIIRLTFFWPTLYVGQKVEPKVFVITSSNIGRFSKFFHCSPRLNDACPEPVMVEKYSSIATLDTGKILIS